MNNISLIIDLLMSNTKNRKFTLAASTVLLDLISELEKLSDSDNLKEILINRFSTRSLNKLPSNSIDKLNSIINLIRGDDYIGLQ